MESPTKIESCNHTLRTTHREYRYVNIKMALAHRGVAMRSRLPLCLRIFIENVLRRADAAEQITAGNARAATA